MKEVITIFKEIQNTSSLNDKKNIIIANKDNELFKKCLVFLLDSNVVTGLSAKKIHKKVDPETELSPLYLSIYSEFTKVIDYLKENNTGRDCDIYEIQCFLDGHEEDREFYEQMITKTFRLGADAKLVNKCIPGLITTFDVQLGTPIEKIKLKGNEWISISQKLNGTRCCWVGNKFMTRQGKEYIGLDHIAKDLIDMGYEDMFVDGELVYKNEEGLSDSEAFQIGTGIANSKSGDKSQLKLVVFDVFPLSEFWNGKSEEAYRVRKYKYLSELQILLEHNNTENVERVTMLYEGNDHSKIMECLNYAEEQGWEGCMVNLDAPYECKRVKTLCKLKKFFSCDICCVDVEEGSGRNKGTLGAIVCDYKGNFVNVGSGFTDEQRKYYWENPQEIVGKIVEVRYKEETKNKNGGISIQFPTFLICRTDKSTESYN